MTFEHTGVAPDGYPSVVGQELGEATAFELDERGLLVRVNDFRPAGLDDEDGGLQLGMLAGVHRARTQRDDQWYVDLALGLAPEPDYSKLVQSSGALGRYACLPYSLCSHETAFALAQHQPGAGQPQVVAGYWHERPGQSGEHLPAGAVVQLAAQALRRVLTQAPPTGQEYAAGDGTTRYYLSPTDLTTRLSGL